MAQAWSRAVTYGGGLGLWLGACAGTGSGEVKLNGLDSGQDSAQPVDLDGDGAPAGLDCDDDDPAVRPGAPERCNGEDDDCDGEIDEVGLGILDADGDGASACDDCDDDDGRVAPDQPERCDGLDNDCDGIVDPEWDLDGDGFASCRGDCDDSDPERNPWAFEACDGKDNDCDGIIDQFIDEDGDGWARCGGDCDDLNAANSPGEAERCDGEDNDCDGVPDADEVDDDGDGVRVCGGDCDDGDPAVAPGRPEACDGKDTDCDPATSELMDGDRDGATACGGDCDDREPRVAPSLAEDCDALDNDCDGSFNEGLSCGGCSTVVVEGAAYLLCGAAQAWTTAEVACAGFSMHLLSLQGAAQSEALVPLAQAALGDTFWIGANDRGREGTFVWSTGASITWSNWARGEPNDAGSGEDCTQIYAGSGQWNDLPCGERLPFVCGE